MPTPAIYGALVGFTVQVYSNVVGDHDFIHASQELTMHTGVSRVRCLRLEETGVYFAAHCSCRRCFFLFGLCKPLMYVHFGFFRTKLCLQAPVGGGVVRGVQIRKYPVFYQPWQHVLFAGVGAWAGVALVDWTEKTSNEVDELLRQRAEANKNLK